MSTIMKDVIIEKSGRTVFELDVPANFPFGKARMILEPQEAEEPHVNRAAEVCGMGKGKVWMSDDFDEPLELVESRKIAKCRKNCDACDF